MRTRGGRMYLALVDTSKSTKRFGEWCLKDIRHERSQSGTPPTGPQFRRAAVRILA